MRFILPQLGLGADYTYSNGYRDANGINSNATSASLQLTQSIFDMSKWRALTLQEKAAGIQDVTYQTDQQTLILNTATAYFNVLNAIDVLSYTQAQKEAIYRQLDQTTQRFNVGLVAITDVQNARAQYDTVLANEVTARNNLDNAVEQLRQITGNYYPELAALNVENFKTICDTCAEMFPSEFLPKFELQEDYSDVYLQGTIQIAIDCLKPKVKLIAK